MNTAFFDYDHRCLVAHEFLPLGEDAVTFTALQLAMIWSFQDGALPSAYWVVWPEDDASAERMRVFFLDQSLDPPTSVLDEIAADVARLIAVH